MLTTLLRRNFGLLWLGGLISLMGDWVLLIGLPIYVYLLTRSVLATSLTVLASALPSVLFGTLAGVFVDRWDRRCTLIVTNLLLAVSLLPLLLVRSADRVWIVYAVTFAANSLDQLVSPAQNALLPSLVGEERLVAANSLSSLSANLARLAGPAVGGLVAAAFALNGIVLADSVSFALAALLVAGIAISPVRTAPSAASGETMPQEMAEVAEAEASALARLWHDWTGGLRVIRRDRTLSVLLAVFAVTALGEGVFGSLYPIFVYRVLHGGAAQIGQLMSAQAVGGLLGGLAVGAVGSRVMSRWTIGLGQVLFGLIDLAIFNTPAYFPMYWLSVGLFVAVGIPGLFSSTGAQSLLQAASPDAYRGRVFGALGTTFGVTLLLGALLAGAITDRLGVVTVLNIQGAGYVLAGIFVVLLLPRGKGATPPGPLGGERDTVAVTGG
jgi:MFS family permease